MSRVDTVGRPMEILLVEDSLVAAKLTMGALRNGHVQHRMTWLTDGNEALSFLHQRGIYGKAPRPDLILLDLGLPGRDGREVLSEIKADPDLKKIPVVVLTASTAAEDLAAAELLHVDGYMNKPVNLEQFLQLVRQLKGFWHAGIILPGE